QLKVRHHCPPTVFPHVTHRLYRNNRDGTFTDISKESGIASAPPAPGLGVILTDLDGDGRLDIYVANDLKPAYLFHNQGQGCFVDVDLDGRLDVAVANGHVYGNGEEIGQPFAQEAQLFVGDGRGHFRDVSAQAGGYFRQPRVGRGLAWADYDNDGRPDLAYSHNAGPVALLHNGTPTENGWVRLELVGDGRK